MGRSSNCGSIPRVASQTVASARRVSRFCCSQRATEIGIARQGETEAFEGALTLEGPLQLAAHVLLLDGEDERLHLAEFLARAPPGNPGVAGVLGVELGRLARVEGIDPERHLAGLGVQEELGDLAVRVHGVEDLVHPDELRAPLLARFQGRKEYHAPLTPLPSLSPLPRGEGEQAVQGHAPAANPGEGEQAVQGHAPAANPGEAEQAVQGHAPAANPGEAEQAAAGARSRCQSGRGRQAVRGTLPLPIRARATGRAGHAPAANPGEGDRPCGARSRCANPRSAGCAASPDACVPFTRSPSPRAAGRGRGEGAPGRSAGLGCSGEGRAVISGGGHSPAVAQGMRSFIFMMAKPRSAHIL